MSSGVRSAYKDAGATAFDIPAAAKTTAAILIKNFIPVSPHKNVYSCNISMYDGKVVYVRQVSFCRVLRLPPPGNIASAHCMKPLHEAVQGDLP